MAFGANKKKQALQEQLLTDIYQLQDEWMQVKSVLEKSVDPSIEGEYELKVAEAKYFFLLREARRLHLNAHG
ncbi:uncharacterized protein DUF2508 [Streptohalobacillus salinus]|uniref:Uncharacterized protein DUF2508 n=1 Tax=Streptohalobacillus salinus TaxID=621096 RepID=A0A2V3W646_9BACI|nr:YaaL family protein [Streptohalobacillus salinus]PXW89843.1 uncharacterized protein DUF2508 [Streptohalobacillus salinus]